jgi:PAT family beta-lactamase induction signal transducer AmpG
VSDAIAAATEAKPPRFVRAMKALKDRRMVAMLLLSFAAGLPYGAVLGTLNAWLTTEGVNPSTIGILSIITLGYSFKYLWAPAFQTPKWIPNARLGARRSWLLMFQIPMACLLALMALSDPGQGIGMLAILALCIALMSATHDIILDAWRIEVARSEEDRDLMAALYQFGYRLSGFITGFVALLLAARFGWVSVYLIIAGMMVLAAIGTVVAPEPDAELNQDENRPSFYASLSITVRRNATVGIAIGWLVALVMILWFMTQALVLDTGASGRLFVRNQGPIIVFLTVMLPALVAAYLLYNQRPTAKTEAEAATQPGILRTLFRAIFDPLMDLIERLRWGVILVLLLALTYRFTDAVWGGFAYPFYLDDRFGALHHSMDDVAIASKFFGVLMTIAGAGLGAIVIAALGRMPVLIAGALLAAGTNLLFADLSAAGRHGRLPVIYLSRRAADCLCRMGRGDIVRSRRARPGAAYGTFDDGDCVREFGRWVCQRRDRCLPDICGQSTLRGGAICLTWLADHAARNAGPVLARRDH